MNTRICFWLPLLWLGVALQAAAGSIVIVTADDASLHENDGTRIVVQVNGKACGLKLDLGNQVIGPKVRGEGTHEFQAFYPKAGTYAIRVTGKRKGNKKACKGSVAPVYVAVADATTTGSVRGTGSTAS